MMKQRIVAVLGALSLLAMAGCASTPDKALVKEEKAVTQPAEPAMAVREKVTATVTSSDWPWPSRHRNVKAPVQLRKSR